jgi:hypothetical protein
MKKYWMISMVAIAVLAVACSKEKTFDCIKSTGDITKETRYFENFSYLEVEDNINVILVQSLPGQVIIEAGENLLPKIKCEQEGTLLRVKNKNTCNWVRSYDKPMNIYVGVDQIKAISQEGYGSIREGETLKTDTLRISNLTFGETDLTIEAKFIGFFVDDYATFKIRGNANSMAGSAAKNASVNTEEMEVRWIVFSNASLLDAKVYSDSLIQAEIYGNGNIICKGNPPLVEYHHFSGEGSLSLP